MSGNAYAVETATLKVVVAPSGEVWYLDGDSLPRQSGRDTRNFLSHPVIRNTEKIRVVGSAANAELVLLLFDLKSKDEVSSVELCSPLVCASAKMRDDPEKVLMAMRRWLMPVSMGGWHELTLEDVASYAMTCALKKDDDVGLLQYYRCHPAYRPLSFLPHTHIHIARLIAHIIDPRWYVDPKAPDRLGKLYAFLGLDPATQSCGGVGHRAYCYAKNRYAQWAWDTVTADASEPNGFLVRYRLSMEAVGKSKDLADLRTSQRLIDFMRQVWLDAIYKAPSGSERLFEPSLYFSPSEASAFVSHMTSQD